MQKSAEQIVRFDEITPAAIISAIRIDQPAPAVMRDRAAITPGPAGRAQSVSNALPAFHSQLQGTNRATSEKIRGCARLGADELASLRMERSMTEWDADSYSRLSGLQKAMADEVLALLTLKGNEQLLDVGCGDGKITALIAARVPHGEVIGVDPSHDMIAFASGHFRHPNLRFEIADARMLPFKERFDLVVSFNALHWVPNPNPVLRSIRSALKPDGRAQLRMVTAGEQRSLESVVEDVRKSPRWRGRFHDFEDPYLRMTADEYATAAKQNGLHVSNVHTELKTWDFGSRAAFFEFSSVGLVAWTKLLPASERGDFVDDVLSRYRSIIRDQSGAERTFKFYQTDISLTRSKDP
jgi:trans-aconitate 2-methyltransferase